MTDGLTRCEGCARHIGPRELYYKSSDFDLCESCAPTWAEELDGRMDRRKAALDAGDEDDATRWNYRTFELQERIRGGLDPAAKAVFHCDAPGTVLQ